MPSGRQPPASSPHPRTRALAGRRPGAERAPLRGAPRATRAALEFLPQTRPETETLDTTDDDARDSTSSRCHGSGPAARSLLGAPPAAKVPVLPLSAMPPPLPANRRVVPDKKRRIFDRNSAVIFDRATPHLRPDRRGIFYIKCSWVLRWPPFFFTLAEPFAAACAFGPRAARGPAQREGCPRAPRAGAIPASSRPCRRTSSGSTLKAAAPRIHRRSTSQVEIVNGRIPPLLRGPAPHWEPRCAGWAMGRLCGAPHLGKDLRRKPGRSTRWTGDAGIVLRRCWAPACPRSQRAPAAGRQMSLPYTATPVGATDAHPPRPSAPPCTIQAAPTLRGAPFRDVTVSQLIDFALGAPPRHRRRHDGPRCRPCDGAGHAAVWRTRLERRRQPPTAPTWSVAPTAVQLIDRLHSRPRHCEFGQYSVSGPLPPTTLYFSNAATTSPTSHQSRLRRRRLPAGRCPLPPAHARAGAARLPEVAQSAIPPRRGRGLSGRPHPPRAVVYTAAGALALPLERRKLRPYQLSLSWPCASSGPTRSTLPSPLSIFPPSAFRKLFHNVYVPSGHRRCAAVLASPLSAANTASPRAAPIPPRGLRGFSWQSLARKYVID